MKKFKQLFRNPFILLLLLIIVIMAIDKCLGQFSFDRGGNFTLYNGGLEPLAATNGTLEEFWFAETIAIIIFPAVLLLFKKRLQLKTHMLPWCAIAIIMLAGVIGTGIDVARQHTERLLDNPGDVSYALHRGASYFPEYIENDPLLFSIVPTFLRAQAPIALGYIVTTFGTGLYKAVKRSKP